VYIGFTGFGIVWVLALGRAFYYNPMTQDKTTIWGMFSYSFIKPWMIRFPSDAPKMKLKDLLVEDVSGGKEPRVSIFRRRFLAQWSKDKSTSRAIFRIMLPWWIFTHALQIPRKVTEFMPTLVIPHILRFLQDPSVPRTLGYKLILLSALRTVVEKSAQALYLFSASNEGTQPAILGAQTAMLQKLHTMSPRARVASSASEIQVPMCTMAFGRPVLLKLTHIAPVVVKKLTWSAASPPRPFLRKWRASRPPSRCPARRGCSSISPPSQQATTSSTGCSGCLLWS
jgi:hypothetical protein